MCYNLGHERHDGVESEPYFRQQRNDALVQLQARLLTLNSRNGPAMENIVRSVASLQQPGDASALTTTSRDDKMTADMIESRFG
jgi:hypothetical protein